MLELSGQLLCPPVQERIYRPDDEVGAQHHRHLALIRAAAVGLALAIAIASSLPLAWQIDRWLADWHYGVTDEQASAAEQEARL